MWNEEHLHPITTKRDDGYKISPDIGSSNVMHRIRQYFPLLCPVSEVKTLVPAVTCKVVLIVDL